MITLQISLKEVIGLTSTTALSNWRRWGILVILLVGGGSIYIMPYLSNFFYKPMMDFMHLNNTQLGLLETAMGITSMIFYWPGGWIADRFSPRKLLTFTFIVNSLLTLWIATFPPYRTLFIIYMIMGVSLTLTYWAALVKCTRQLGSSKEQGRFFGTLEGGRNLTQFGVSGLALAIFAALGSGALGLKWGIISMAAVLFIVGVLCWICIGDEYETVENDHSENTDPLSLWKIIVTCVKLPAVWMVMIIILCAYMTSDGITYLTPYATDVYKQSAVFGGMLYNITAITSVFVSPFAGFLADRFSTSKTMLWGLIILVVCWLLFVLVKGGPTLFAFMLINAILIGCALYALRGIYYALLEEGSIPVALTGSATGLISLIAYTPDVFLFVLAGHLLDKYAAGNVGYTYIWIILAASALVGVIMTLVFMKYNGKRKARAISSSMNDVAVV
jgi:sugar phosphate permease